MFLSMCKHAFAGESQSQSVRWNEPTKWTASVLNNDQLKQNTKTFISKHRDSHLSVDD